MREFIILKYKKRRELLQSYLQQQQQLNNNNTNSNVNDNNNNNDAKVSRVSSSPVATRNINTMPNPKTQKTRVMHTQSENSQTRREETRSSVPASAFSDDGVLKPPAEHLILVGWSGNIDRNEVFVVLIVHPP